MTTRDGPQPLIGSPTKGSFFPHETDNHPFFPETKLVVKTASSTPSTPSNNNTSPNKNGIHGAVGEQLDNNHHHQNGHKSSPSMLERFESSSFPTSKRTSDKQQQQQQQQLLRSPHHRPVARRASAAASFTSYQVQRRYNSPASTTTSRRQQTPPSMRFPPSDRSPWGTPGGQGGGTASATSSPAGFRLQQQQFPQLKHKLSITSDLASVASKNTLTTATTIGLSDDEVALASSSAAAAAANTLSAFGQHLQTVTARTRRENNNGSPHLTQSRRRRACAKVHSPPPHFRSASMDTTDDLFSSSGTTTAATTSTTTPQQQQFLVTRQSSSSQRQPRRASTSGIMELSNSSSLQSERGRQPPPQRQRQPRRSSVESSPAAISLARPQQQQQQQQQDRPRPIVVVKPKKQSQQQQPKRESQRTEHRSNNNPDKSSNNNGANPTTTTTTTKKKKKKKTKKSKNASKQANGGAGNNNEAGNNNNNNNNNTSSKPKKRKPKVRRRSSCATTSTFTGSSAASKRKAKSASPTPVSRNMEVALLDSGALDFHNIPSRTNRQILHWTNSSSGEIYTSEPETTNHNHNSLQNFQDLQPPPSSSSSRSRDVKRPQPRRMTAPSHHHNSQKPLQPPKPQQPQMDVATTEDVQGFQTFLQRYGEHPELAIAMANAFEKFIKQRKAEEQQQQPPQQQVPVNKHRDQGSPIRSRQPTTESSCQIPRSVSHSSSPPARRLPFTDHHQDPSLSATNRQDEAFSSPRRPQLNRAQQEEEEKTGTPRRSLSRKDDGEFKRRLVRSDVQDDDDDNSTLDSFVAENHWDDGTFVSVGTRQQQQMHQGIHGHRAHPPAYDHNKNINNNSPRPHSSTTGSFQGDSDSGLASNPMHMVVETSTTSSSRPKRSLSLTMVPHELEALTSIHSSSGGPTVARLPPELIAKLSMQSNLSNLSGTNNNNNRERRPSDIGGTIVVGGRSPINSNEDINSDGGTTITTLSKVERTPREMLSFLSSDQRTVVLALQKKWEDTPEGKAHPMPLDWYIRFARHSPGIPYTFQSAWKVMKKFDVRYLDLNIVSMEKHLLSRIVFEVPGLKTKGGYDSKFSSSVCVCVCVCVCV